MSFFWLQQSGGEDAWLQCLSEHRAKVIQERQPAFVTVLDAHSSPEPGWGREDYAKMKYSGPFYADWDGEDLADVIPNFQKFLKNLGEMGVNLKSLRLYATGGRGFHLEIPPAVFMPKAVRGGVTGLPYIYREMAMEMVVDTLDMRVYSGRKGRMWRTPNVQRPNGKYKVPILLEDALEMTPQLYESLCSQPTPEPVRDEPDLNTVLAAMFIKAQSKVEEAVKRRVKSVADESLLAKFKGQFPPTVKKLMTGEGVAPGIGFQRVAMQLAITANALGKTADELVEACEGLCEKHQSDSSRYNSPRKRKEELRRMWEYTHDNPCYGYSRGGIRSICDVDLGTSDLDGIAGSTGVGHVPDSDEDEIPEDAAAEVEAGQNSLLEGMMITKSGIHKRTAEGAKTLSNISFRRPLQLVDAEDNKVLGLEADVYADGKGRGRHLITAKVFGSRANLSAYCAEHGGIFSGSDTQAGVVSLMLTRAAQAKGNVVYALHREGLDLVQDPAVKEKVVRDLVWVHPDKVISNNQDANYVYQPLVTGSAIYNADVHNATPLVCSQDNIEWLRALFQINSPTIVAQMLGWMVSCFHKQFYHRAFQQFPLLHPNGPAGCGKTLTTRMMLRLFYLTTEPKTVNVSVATPFTLKGMMAGSASVPAVFDEYKPSELDHRKLEQLLQIFRGAYNQAEGASGGISRGNASASFRDVTSYTLSAPLVYIGESQEMQTAIVQRTVPVGFNPSDTSAHTEWFKLAQAGADRLPALGNLLLGWTFRETVDSRREALQSVIDRITPGFGRSVNPRQIYNTAVLIAGLEFMRNALKHGAVEGQGFGDALTGEVDRLIQALWEHRDEVFTVAMSEASKVLNDMSLMSRTEPDESEFALREGHEYIVVDGYIEILLREAFVKYFAWCKRKGFQPLYSTAEQFVLAMRRFPAVTDKLCKLSPLRKAGGLAHVHRFSLEKLQMEGVEPFATRAG